MDKVDMTIEELKERLEEEGETESGLCEAIGNDYDYIRIPVMDDEDNLGFFLIHLKEGLAILPYNKVTVGSGWEQLNLNHFRYAGEEDLYLIERAEREMKRMEEGISFMKRKLRFFTLFHEGRGD